MKLWSTISYDLKCKARWCYGNDNFSSLVKTVCTDGTVAMIIYRLMQWSRRVHLAPMAMVFNKFNAVFCNCIIGRGADFGPGFVLIHSTGVVINADVVGGHGIYIEHQVTIGAERRQAPMLGSNIFIGAGAKIIGPVVISDGARIGANAVVVDDIPEHSTAVGVPAKVVCRRAAPDSAAQAV